MELNSENLYKYVLKPSFLVIIDLIDNYQKGCGLGFVKSYEKQDLIVYDLYFDYKSLSKDNIRFCSLYVKDIGKKYYELSFSVDMSFAFLGSYPMTGVYTFFLDKKLSNADLAKGLINNFSNLYFNIFFLECAKINSDVSDFFSNFVIDLADPEIKNLIGEEVF